jgi:transcriptional regulator with XRE-family HTH domain
MRTAREPQPALGAALRHFRHKAELSQEALSQSTGVHRTWISQIEQGHNNPAWGTVVRLAGGLGITLGELAAAIEDPKGCE